MCMSVAEEAIRKATRRANNPMECWVCTNTPRYHAGMLHTYKNLPNKMDPDVTEFPHWSTQEYDQRN